MTPQEYQKQQNEKLLKSFVVDVKLKSKDDSKRQSFHNIANNLYNVQLILEQAHRQTTNESHHRAFGEAYTAISDLKDTIIENIIGVLGINSGELNLPTIKEYKTQDNDNIVNYIMELSNVIESFAKENKISSVENYSQDLFAIAAQLKYKLSLN